MRKKKSAEPEMGYCPFEHWLGRTRRLGAHGAWARGWALGAGELGRGRAGCEAGRPGRATGRLGPAGRATGRLGRAAGARRALGARAGCRRAACAHLGVLAGLWALHSMHSACFDPISTQYCS